jgi:aminobenzoyl-glutamate utilization protein B
VAACAGMSIGHKGLLFASKALAATMVDLFEKAELRQQIRAEFLDKTKDQVYKAYIPEGPPPVASN